MMLSEFKERTGFEPTAEEYEEIENAYYNFDGEKDEFCRKFIEEDGVLQICELRRKKIEKLKSKVVEVERMLKSYGDEMESRLAELEEALDKELEWRDCDNCGTNLDEDKYMDLAGDCATRELSDDESKQFIYDEFGFSPEKVDIIREASTYEVNRHRMLRKKHTYERMPLYNATDWNYVRFNCRGWSYECVNGDLRFYEH